MSGYPFGGDPSAFKPCRLSLGLLSDLEYYLSLRRAATTYLRDHPGLNEFLDAMEGRNYDAAFDAAMEDEL